jgi:hypothetical protein
LFLLFQNFANLSLVTEDNPFQLFVLFKEHSKLLLVKLNLL